MFGSFTSLRSEIRKKSNGALGQSKFHRTRRVWTAHHNANLESTRELSLLYYAYSFFSVERHKNWIEKSKERGEKIERRKRIEQTEARMAGCAMMSERFNNGEQWWVRRKAISRFTKGAAKVHAIALIYFWKFRARSQRWSFTRKHRCLI